MKQLPQGPRLQSKVCPKRTAGQHVYVGHPKETAFCKFCGKGKAEGG